MELNAINNMIEKRFIDFVNKELLSGEEFTILYLIYQNKVDEDINEKFEQYITNNAGKFDYKNLITNLEKLKFLENLNKKNEFDLDKIKVTKKFADKFFIPIDVAWEEVIKMYPKKIISQDRKNATPTFGNLEKEKATYQNFIENRIDKHHEFMLVMEKYLESKSDGKWIYKFSNFLENFSGIKIAIEDVMNDSTMADDFEVL